MTTVDVRCPHGARGRLFLRLRLGEVQLVQPGNSIEAKCRDCTRHQGHEVVHAWNVLGEYLGDV